jgi:hypothetical protein
VVVAAWAAAAVLAYAGGAKLLDPTMTAGALRAMGLPSAPGLVRLGAGTELALGIAAVVVGGSLLWGLVAASYVAFAAFVVAALASGRPIATCGCFGREDTPPSVRHVALNVAAALACAAYAALG